MTRAEFCEKHKEFQSADGIYTTDVLMRIAGNLSDLHLEKDFFTSEEIDIKLNNLKEYVLDFKSVLRMEERHSNSEKINIK